jgi:hypothetical protein
MKGSRTSANLLLAALLAPSRLHAGVFYQGDLADLAKESQLVVLGEVREVKGLSGGQWLATIQIDEVFKGPAKSTVTIWAGSTVEDVTSASVGERLVLFLQPSSVGDTDVKQVAWRGRGRMVVASEHEELMVRVPATVRLPPTLTPVKEPIRADGSALARLTDLRALIKSTLPVPGSSGLRGLPYNAVAPIALASISGQVPRLSTRGLPQSIGGR